MKLTLNFKKLLLFFAIFLLTVVVVVFWQLGIRLSKPVSPNFYQAYAKWNKQFNKNTSIRSENLNAIVQALESYEQQNSSLLKQKLSWYSVDFVPYDPNVFILNTKAQVLSKEKKFTVFKKGDVVFMASQYNYFGKTLWRGTTNTPRFNDVDELAKQLGLSATNILAKKDKTKCFALDNACVYLTPGFPLLRADKLGDVNITRYDISFAFIKNLNIKKVGDFKFTGKLSRNYLIYINQMKGPRFFKYTFLPAEAKSCGEGGCLDNYPLNLADNIASNITVVNVEQEYMLLPLAPKTAEQQNIVGYLIPFWKVNLRGDGKYNNTPYLLDLYILIPATPLQ